MANTYKFDVIPLIDYMLGFYLLLKICEGDTQAREVTNSDLFRYFTSKYSKKGD